MSKITNDGLTGLAPDAL